MPRHRTNHLASISFADLQRELARRQERHPHLERRRAQLLEELATINAELGNGSSDFRLTKRRGRRAGSSSRPRGGRAKNSTSLSQVLQEVLKGKTMGVAEAAAAARKAGYKSNAPSFRIMVNAALLKGPFKKVARGQYTVS